MVSDTRKTYYGLSAIFLAVGLIIALPKMPVLSLYNARKWATEQAQKQENSPRIKLGFIKALEDIDLLDGKIKGISRYAPWSHNKDIKRIWASMPFTGYRERDLSSNIRKTFYLPDERIDF